jgi:hypothetical protein
MRAQKHLVLPEEDAAEFAALEAALIEELVPVGALQMVLARRVAVSTWRLARADRLAAGTGLGPRCPTRRSNRPSCSRSAGSRAAGSGSPSSATATGRGRSRLCCVIAARPWRSSGARCARSRRSRPSRRSHRSRPDDIPAAARGAASSGPTSATERTRARRPGSTAIHPGRTARVRCPARGRCAVATERTRDWPHRARAVGRPQPNAARAATGLEPTVRQRTLTRALGVAEAERIRRRSKLAPRPANPAKLTSRSSASAKDRELAQDSHGHMDP